MTFLQIVIPRRLFVCACPFRKGGFHFLRNMFYNKNAGIGRQSQVSAFPRAIA